MACVDPQEPKAAVSAGTLALTAGRDHKAEPLVAGAGSSPKLNAGRHAFLVQQKRSASLVLVGAVCVLLGTVITCRAGWIKYTSYQENFLGQPFPSGTNFIPNTISLLVSRPDSPEGKSFFAFGLLGCICLLFSWYPWQLKNVYSGDDQRILCWFGPSWATLRHFLPPCGIMIVACLPVIPTPQRREADLLLLVWHNLGAELSLGGYLVTELFYLVFGGRHAGYALSRLEWHLRCWLTVAGLICVIVFLIADDYTAKFKDIGCDDTWRVPTAADLALLKGDSARADLYAQASFAHRTGLKLLYDTASGHCLMVKHLEVWSEALAGVIMSVHMIIIWFFCPERQIGLAERLPDVDDEEERSCEPAEVRGVYTLVDRV